MIGPARSGTEAAGRRVVAAVSVNIFAAILSAIVGLLATGLMARWVSVADFGRIVLLLTLITAFAIFEGQRPVIIQRIAAGASNRAELFSASARINLAIVAIAAAVSLAAVWLWPTSFMSPLMTGLLVLTVCAFFGMMQYWTFLDAEMDTIFTGVARSGAWVMLYAAFAALAFAQAPIEAFAGAILFMHCLLCALFAARFRALGLVASYHRDAAGENPRLIGPALSNIVFNGCAVTISLADRGIIGAIMGPNAAGLYAGPSEVALRALGLVRAGIQVILPWAARLSPREQERRWLLAVIAILLAAGTVAALVLAFRGSLVVLLLGENFRASGHLLGMFAVGALISTIGYACVVRLNAQGDFHSQRHAYLIGAAILLLGATIGAREGSLMMVGTAFLCARSLDLYLLAKLLWGSSHSPRLMFSTTATALALSLLSLWLHHPLAGCVLLLSSYGLAYLTWRKMDRD